MNKKKYNESWSDQIRPAILKRDNYKCKICKVRHRSVGYYNSNKEFVECDEFMLRHCDNLKIKICKIILQVHHKNGNVNDNGESNLITLCVRCHLNVERNLSILKRKMTGIIYKKK